MAKAIAREHRAIDGCDAVVFDLSEVPHLDVTASLSVENAVKEAIGKGREVFLVDAGEERRSTLETLDLFSNAISCITPGAFDGIRNLRALNMVSNSINCNCHMGWFSEWVKQKGFSKTGPRCSRPEALRNRAIHELAAHDFQCDGETCLKDCNTEL